MKKVFFFIAFLFTASNSFAQTSVYVSGYTNNNGTYVSGYTRSYPSYSTYSTPTYSTPTYSSSSYSTPTYNSAIYSTPSYSAPTTYYNTTPIYTGSRGGQYYINSNGNKTYVSN